MIRIALDELAITSFNAWEDIYLAKSLAPKNLFSQTPLINEVKSLFIAIR
jgi:hypothetical protein